MKNLILIAAPGAGKGTLSKDLLSKYDYAIKYSTFLKNFFNIS